MAARYEGGTRMAFDIAPVALVGLAARGLLPAVVVRAGRMVWVSPGFLGMFRLSASGAIGLHFLEVVAEKDRALVAGALDETPGAIVTATVFRGLRADATQFDADMSCAAFELPGGPAVAILVRDISEQRRAQTRLAELAFSDSLTELPNRALFLDRLRQALVDVRRHGGRFAVLVGDLDGFKQINDRYGHETGDALLQVVAKRLRAAVREGDTLARLGGDEFAALLPRATNQHEAAIVANRIVGALHAPITVAGQKCEVGFSAGLALYPANGKDIDALMAHADGAMYVAKRAGGRRFEFARARQADITGPLRLPVFEWQDGYVIGVPLMDEEHKKLADLINRLGHEFKTGQDGAKLTEALQTLLQAARSHLLHEEWLITNAGLSGITDAQKQEQRVLIEELESQATHADGKSMALTMRYLNGWLSRHIEWSRLYASEMIDQGLQV